MVNLTPATRRESVNRVSQEDERFRSFVDYASALQGRERPEAHLFCEHLFVAFGHAGLIEAGASLEYPAKRKGHSIRFADLYWDSRLLIEMKSRGQNLAKHYGQAFEYWIRLVPKRPKYVVLCNFDEFWIYDFNIQLDSPMDIVKVVDLPTRYPAMSFLFPDERKPQFGNDRVSVTRKAADQVAQVFNSLLERGEDRGESQRYVLQSVVAMFAEDVGLLPRGLYSRLLQECVEGGSAYDLVGALFRQMDTEIPARAGRYTGVSYFNGGLFSVVDPLELELPEVQLLANASAENWALVAPPVFGTLFQGSMGKEKRHAHGAHFTSEADIQKVVLPVIVRPWRRKISEASTLQELKQLLTEIRQFKVLDPACGSGNFLYVAYRELVRLEVEIIAKVHEKFKKRAREEVGATPQVSTKQFFGIDLDPFAVELAKVTLMLAKRIALAEIHDSPFAAQHDLPLDFESPLPLDNLDSNVVCDDALFCPWPQSDVVIGNPPFQSKNKMQAELGREYVSKLHRRYPNHPGRADYVTYWFRLAHDHLKEGQRAGLVATNTIRQNYSREASLDYILDQGGLIEDAVSTQVWSGDAQVHVSLVCWIRGKSDGPFHLAKQLGDSVDSQWASVEVERISPSLSEKFDVTKAVSLKANTESSSCFQGQTHGHKGFLLDKSRAKLLLSSNPEFGRVLRPYMIADDLLGATPPAPRRYSIDFSGMELLEAQGFGKPFDLIRENVLPDREAKAFKERAENELLLNKNPEARVNRHHEKFLRQWWQFSWPRTGLVNKLQSVSRYIVCGRVTKRPIFEFVDTHVRPNDALVVFLFEDDYSFGILQSKIHGEWFTERCSTLKGDPRYTSTTVFDSFPWPQNPSQDAVTVVAKAAQEIRAIRFESIMRHGVSLRELYRSLELPGDSPLKRAHENLDKAVFEAYQFKRGASILNQTFELNQVLAQQEVEMQAVVGPGLPTGMQASCDSLPKAISCID